MPSACQHWRSDAGCRSLPKGEAAKKVVNEILRALRAAKILRGDASPLSTCAAITVQGYASDPKISIATTLSIVDGALDLGHNKRRPLQIGNTPMPTEEIPRPHRSRRRHVSH